MTVTSCQKLRKVLFSVYLQFTNSNVLQVYKMVNLRDAAKVYQALNGVICVYKPATVPLRQVQHTIVTNLCRDLNALPDRPQEQRVVIDGPTNAPMRVRLEPNYADHVLACGPRYINDDIKCSWANHLGLFTSGVLVLGINAGTRLTYHLNMSRPTRAYKVQGQLGKATDTYFWNGRVMERASYKYVTREKIDAIVAHIQAAHQKAMFEVSGVDKSSQTAFEMASQGLIRPGNSKLPVLYGIKCVHFQPPDFTLEIQSINEYDKYLWTLIHDVGVQLKTAAHCTAVQCIRVGKFDLEYALLRKHWTLEHMYNNMNKCRQLIDDNEEMLHQTSAVLV